MAYFDGVNLAFEGLDCSCFIIIKSRLDASKFDLLVGVFRCKFFAGGSLELLLFILIIIGKQL